MKKAVEKKKRQRDAKRKLKINLPEPLTGKFVVVRTEKRDAETVEVGYLSSGGYSYTKHPADVTLYPRKSDAEESIPMALNGDTVTYTVERASKHFAYSFTVDLSGIPTWKLAPVGDKPRSLKAAIADELKTILTELKDVSHHVQCAERELTQVKAMHQKVLKSLAAEHRQEVAECQVIIKDVKREHLEAEAILKNYNATVATYAK